MTIHHTIRAIAACGALAFIVAALPNTYAQTPAPGAIGSAISGESTVQNGLFLQGKDSYRIVDTAAFRTAADVGQTQPGSIAQVGYGCTSCGTSACGGNCGTTYETVGCATGSCGTGACGSGACGSGGCGVGGYGNAFGNPCAPCDPYCYVSAEVLYMDNDSIGGFTLSPDFRLQDFDYELGSRITIGSVDDCVHGYEVTFTGPMEWERDRRAFGNAGDLSTRVRPRTVGDIADLTSFADFVPVIGGAAVVPTATSQRQRFEAEYWSLEASRTLVSGDFVKLLCGGRYINYDEEYSYSSRSAAGFGQIFSRTKNDMYGLQAGMDLLYPICCHGYTDMRMRAGAYINSASNDFVHTNADAFVRGAQDDTTELAGMFEWGVGASYQVGQILTLRAGTELWYLTEIASAPRQFSRNISDRSGRSTSTGSDVLMTGVNFGAEIRY